MRPPRTVILLQRLERGGAERQAVNLARGLKARGWPVAVAVFYAGGALEPELRAAGVPLLCPAKRGRWDLASFGRGLWRLLRRFRPRVLYSFLDVANLVALALAPWLPGCRVVWGVRASNMDLLRYDRLSRVAFRLAARLSRLPRLVIANSWAGREHHLAAGYPPTRTVVVPNGIDTERFRPHPAAGTRRRAAWGLGPEVPLVGLVGRLDPMKDHDRFLAAAARAVLSRPELRFVCVGGGPAAELARLQGLARSLGLGERVLWTGPEQDMPAVYNALDLAVSTSAFGEGFPNVVAEAMACAVPVVVTAVGDAARLLDDSLRVARPRDPDDMARRWLAVLELEPAQRARLGARDRRRVVERFSLERMVERTAALLAQAAGD